MLVLRRDDVSQKSKRDFLAFKINKRVIHGTIQSASIMHIFWNMVLTILTRKLQILFFTACCLWIEKKNKHEFHFKKSET